MQTKYSVSELIEDGVAASALSAPDCGGGWLCIGGCWAGGYMY